MTDTLPADVDDLAPASADETPPPATAGRVVRIGRFLADHPVATTALAGIAFVAIQMWWVSSYRHLGAFNVDEEGGIAAALRFHRNVGMDPRPLIRAIFHTWNGPVVPLLSVPALVPGARNATWVILAQPIIVVGCGCAVAGMVRALGHPRAGLVGGLITILLPVSVVSSRSYQYSTGVAMFLAFSLWGLLVSDRCRRTWPMIGVGASVAAMTMSRTMAIGFVPGVVLAMLVITSWERRSIRNIVFAGLTALAVGGPWWAANAHQIYDYLYINAYGPRAHFWGRVGFSQRLSDHIGYFVTDFGVLYPLCQLAAVAVAVGIVIALVRHHRAKLWRSPYRELLAIWVAAGMGFVALLSTSNAGYWFGYPMDVLVVAGVVGLAALTPWPVIAGRRVPVAGALATIALLVCTVSFGVSLRPLGQLSHHANVPIEEWVAPHDVLMGGNVEADPRMGSRSERVRRQAAADWWKASTTLAREVGDIQKRRGELVQSIIGEIHLMNANTIGLTEEVTNDGINGLDVVNTLEPPDAVLRRSLTPKVGAATRVIVMIEGKSLGFPDGRGWRRFRRLAVEEGWKPRHRIPLPDGGAVVLYEHPANLGKG